MKNDSGIRPTEVARLLSSYSCLLNHTINSTWTSQLHCTIAHHKRKRPHKNCAVAKVARQTRGRAGSRAELRARTSSRMRRAACSAESWPQCGTPSPGFTELNCRTQIFPFTLMWKFCTGVVSSMPARNTRCTTKRVANRFRCRKLRSLFRSARRQSMAITHIQRHTIDMAFPICWISIRTHKH